MQVPDGYDKPNKICKLKKALYGLKQASLKWNDHLTNVLKRYGLFAINIEKCIFKNADSSIILAIYVDDGLIVGSDYVKLNMLINQLTEHFQVRIFEKPEKFIGIQLDIKPN